MLSVARSFRTHKLKPLINRDLEQFVVFGEVHSESAGARPIGVQRSRSDGSVIKVNGRRLTSTADLAIELPLLVINSDTFTLLEGSPTVRRHFLDWCVFHVEHGFHEAWKSLTRCLKQRNSLLRSDRMDAQQLEVWTAELVRAGEQVDVYRQHYFERLKPAFERCIDALLVLDGLSLDYYRGWDRQQSLAEQLNNDNVRDCEQGYTHRGPQRADIRIKHHGLNAADTLSRGQQKLLVCALRIAQGYLLSEMTGRRCVYLVDDLPAELDAVHRKALCGLLEKLQCQVFISCVDYRDLINCWSGQEEIKMFHVEQGVVSAVSNS